MNSALIGSFPLPEVFAILYKIILSRDYLSGFLVICFQDKKLFKSFISDLAMFRTRNLDIKDEN